MPVPKNKKELRSFLGLANFYRKLIWRFAKIAGPLTEKLRESVEDGKDENWLNEGEKKAFEKLKEKLSSPPVLAHPDFSKQFYIQVMHRRCFDAEG